MVRKVRRKGYKNLLNNLNCSDFIFASQIELTNRTMYCYTLIFLQWDNIKTCFMILISMLKLFNLSKCYFATLSSCEMLMLMASLAKSGLKLKSSMNGWQNENLFVSRWKWNNIINVNLFIISYYVDCMMKKKSFTIEFLIKFYYVEKSVQCAFHSPLSSLSDT